MKNKYSIKDVNKIAIEKGGICLSDKYINMGTSLKWKCAKSHEWITTFKTVKGGSWCPYCAGNAINTIEEAKQLAYNKSGQCLSNKYINSSSSLLWKYVEGHEWYKSLYYVKNCNAWCPECRKISHKLKEAKNFAHNKGG